MGTDNAAGNLYIEDTVQLLKQWHWKNWIFVFDSSWYCFPFVEPWTKH